jgi:hypothetical protein
MRIEAPHYVAGIDWEKKRTVIGTKLVLTDMVYTVKECAPIVAWIKQKNWTLERAAEYFKQKGFVVTLTYGGAMKYYTGVGSRRTPANILAMMTRLAQAFAHHGYTLRSGGAQGADSAFAAGALNKADIYLASDCTPESMEIAKRFHPAWDRCSAFARSLHGRNTLQVLGNDLKTPSDFLICWTPDGCVSHATRSIETGGTGTAISIAEAYGVTVNNLARPEHFAHWDNYLKG